MFKFCLLSLSLMASSAQAVDHEVSTGLHASFQGQNKAGAHNDTSQDLRHISELSTLNAIEDEAQITAPYDILSETLYTPDMNVYAYGKHNIQIINKENPDKIVLQITENLQPKGLELKKNDTKVKLPWWSSVAPSILQALDFSKVDGKSKVYQIGDHHQLTLLAEQGAWGMVYVLERISSGSTKEKICAVKLLITRTDTNDGVEFFRERHKQEIDNNLQLSDLRMDIAIEPYGIIENDPDHYLLFLEYGENANDRFKNQSLDTSIDQIHAFLHKINALHAAGVAHGDLKIANMLLVNNRIKLCDWLSLSAFTNDCVGKYRYIGDNLPPEAMRAFYFKENNELAYAKIFDNDREAMYILHPIAADRFCLAISLLEIMAPDLYQGFEKLIPKGFNPYGPESLDFWQAHIAYLKETRKELLLRATKADNIKKSRLLLQMAHYIHVDPLQRKE